MKAAAGLCRVLETRLGCHKQKDKHPKPEYTPQLTHNSDSDRTLTTAHTRMQMTKATLVTRNESLILLGLTTLLAKHEVLETTTAG